jgi:hypothetical protein
MQRTSPWLHYEPFAHKCLDQVVAGRRLRGGRGCMLTGTECQRIACRLDDRSVFRTLLNVLRIDYFIVVNQTTVKIRVRHRTRRSPLQKGPPQEIESYVRHRRAASSSHTLFVYPQLQSFDFHPDIVGTLTRRILARQFAALQFDCNAMRSATVMVRNGWTMDARDHRDRSVPWITCRWTDVNTPRYGNVCGICHDCIPFR